MVSGAEGFETGQDRAVCAEGPQGTVVLDIFGVTIERVGDGGALGFRFGRRLRWNDAVLHGGQFSLLVPRGFRGGEGVRPGGLLHAFPLLPPFDEIPALGVGFIPALHADMVAADAALAVEQGGGRNPSAVVLDLFEEDDAGLSWHSAILRRGRWPVPVLTAYRISYKIGR